MTDTRQSENSGKAVPNPVDVLHELVETWGVDSIRDAFEARWPPTDGPEEPERAMPAAGHFLRALGIDPRNATDDDPHVRFAGPRVFVTYTALLTVSPETFSRAAVQIDGWIPA